MSLQRAAVIGRDRPALPWTSRADAQVSATDYKGQQVCQYAIQPCNRLAISSTAPCVAQIGGIITLMRASVRRCAR